MGAEPLTSSKLIQRRKERTTKFQNFIINDLQCDGLIKNKIIKCETNVALY